MPEQLSDKAIYRLLKDPSHHRLSEMGDSVIHEPSEYSREAELGPTRIDNHTKMLLHERVQKIIAARIKNNKICDVYSLTRLADLKNRLGILLKQLRALPLPPVRTEVSLPCLIKQTNGKNGEARFTVSIEGENGIKRVQLHQIPTEEYPEPIFPNIEQW